MTSHGRIRIVNIIGWWVFDTCTAEDSEPSPHSPNANAKPKAKAKARRSLLFLVLDS